MKLRKPAMISICSPCSITWISISYVLIVLQTTPLKPGDVKISVLAASVHTMCRSTPKQRFVSQTTETANDGTHNL
jgi:hypothetical protein